MNDSQLAALTEGEREEYLHGHEPNWVASGEYRCYSDSDELWPCENVRLLTALADARLERELAQRHIEIMEVNLRERNAEVTRLKATRDKLAEGNQRIVQRNLDLEVEVARYRMSEAESG